jgi:energy-coupling factor transport system ATP-binding protein
VPRQDMVALDINEPLEEFLDEILDQIAELHKKTGITVILVSHSMEDIAKYVDRIIVMNRGEKFLDGTPREVFAHYQELEEVGLAAPQVTYIMHDLRQNGLQVGNDVTTVEEAADEIMRYFRGKHPEETKL